VAPRWRNQGRNLATLPQPSRFAIDAVTTQGIFRPVATAIGPAAKPAFPLGATKMKKVLIAAAAAGLMSLAACTPPAANNTAEANGVEANAAIYDDTANLGTENAMVDNMSEGNVADMNMSGNAM
jgi:hypothetical protein